MSDSNQNPNGGLNGFGQFFVDRLKISITTAIIWGSGVVLLVLLSPWRDQIVSVWQTPARVANLETMIERNYTTFRGAIEEITTQVGQLSGDAKVVRVDRAGTYVEEPVHIGDPVTLILVAQRTELGAACVLRYHTPLFTDETAIAMAGERTVPARQLTTTKERQRLILQPPVGLRPGRVTVSMALEFDCQSGPIYEVNEPVAFRLLEHPA